MKRQLWTKQEDKLLSSLINKNPTNPKWEQISFLMQKAGYRKSVKQIKARWTHNLNPSLSKKKWTPEESLKLFNAFHKLDNKWMVISQDFKGRTDNCVKNQFFSIIRKALRSALKRLKRKSPKPENSRTINKIKPRVLINFLKETVAIKGKSGSEESIEVIDFVRNFTFGDKKLKISFIGLTEEEVLEGCLDKLIMMNDEYTQRKEDVMKYRRLSDLAKREERVEKNKGNKRPIELKKNLKKISKLADSVQQLDIESREGGEHLDSVLNNLERLIKETRWELEEVVDNTLKSKPIQLSTIEPEDNQTTQQSLCQHIIDLINYKEEEGDSYSFMDQGEEEGRSIDSLSDLNNSFNFLGSNGMLSCGFNSGRESPRYGMRKREGFFSGVLEGEEGFELVGIKRVKER